MNVLSFELLRLEILYAMKKIYSKIYMHKNILLDVFHDFDFSELLMKIIIHQKLMT